MTGLFDSHCHLTHERFRGEVAAVLERARDAGVTRVVTVASDGEDAEAALELARRHPGVWSTAGIHPHVAGEAGAGDLARIADLAGGGEVVAIGETGLDFHYDHSPRDVQRRIFRRHLELAEELGLPVVVHSRSADEDTADLLRDAGRGVRGVLHCFVGGRDLLETALGIGWYVSYTGIATFSGFDGEEGVRSVPSDRLMVETDAPYLAPVPERGKRNEPAFVGYVAGRLAAIRGETPEELVRRTTENALRFYGIAADDSAGAART